MLKNKWMVPVCLAAMLVTAPYTSVFAADKEDTAKIQSEEKSIDISDEALLQLIIDKLPEDKENVHSNIHLDDNYNYYYDVSVDGVTKDTITELAKSNKDLKKQFLDVVSIYSNVSETGHDLLDSIGKGDQMFIARVFDDVSDETSDLICCCVNGDVLYSCLQ